jgi:phosphatidylglycerol---prolipoprotein diacylglyceryl transferase
VNSVIADIPFVRPGSLDLGPIELQPFGIVVAIGVIVGVYIMRRWGESHGLDEDHIRGLVNWSVILGFIGAHVFDVIAYQHHRLADDPLLIFKLWDGISSYGGFIGGTAGFFIYATRNKLPLARYADVCMVGVATGFTIGRLACTLVHDHIGAYTEDFPLATYYSKEVIMKYGFGSPPGTLQPGLHHNLGFYEFLYMLLLCAMMYGLSRWKRRPDGFLAAAVATAYAPVRFFLDFLRVNPDADPRYLGLTFAQWMSIVLTIAGLYLLGRILGRAASSQPATAAVVGLGKTGADRTGADRAGAGQSGRKTRARKTAPGTKAGKAGKAADQGGSTDEASREASTGKARKRRKKK